jgi:hypothetical protein
MATYGGYEAVIRGHNANAVQWSMIAGHVLFGEAGDRLPAHRVALAGEERVADEPEADIEVLAFGEIY